MCNHPFSSDYCSIVEDRLNAVPQPTNRVADYSVDDCYFALMNVPHWIFLSKNAKNAHRKIIRRLKFLGKEVNEECMRPMLPSNLLNI